MKNQLRLLWLVISFIPLGSAMGSDPVKEFIGGVGIPIPTEMTKASEDQLELMIPGFKGGQIAFRGNMAPRDIVAFYQKQMPKNGWTPYAALVSEQGLLVFTKANQSVLIMVSESKGATILAILVGSTTAQ